MTHWGARTRQIGTLTMKILEFLPEGSGLLGVAPTCIVRLRAVDTLRCCVMDARCARSTTKSGFAKFSSSIQPRAARGAKETIHFLVPRLCLGIHIYRALPGNCLDFRPIMEAEPPGHPFLGGASERDV
jgi:hypothetical protein